MRQGRKAPGRRGQGTSRLPARQMCYEKLAGGLAFEMAECLCSREAREFSAPFELLIVDPQGAVVFRCEVGEDWQVRHNGPSRMIQQQHFPATVMLTDRSLLTRTFQMDQARRRSQPVNP